MSTVGRTIRDRLLPAILTAAGVTLIAAGLLSYTGSASAADPDASAAPTIVTADPSAGLALPTLPPPGASPSIAACRRRARTRTAVATRVVIEALGIDLPIIKPPRRINTYPAATSRCTSSTRASASPDPRKATYLYAHARDGMFGPIYDRAIQKKHGGPKSMVGMIVQVFTSDDMMLEYQITKVCSTS